MKKTLLFSAGILLVALQAVGAGEAAVKARFYNERIYFLSDEPILVEVTLANTGASPYHFRLADERAFSLDVEAFSMRNIPLAKSDSLAKKRSGSRQVFFREVVLEPGESFSFVEDMRDYVELTEAGTFVCRVRFYPNVLKAENTDALTSNRLRLNLHPPAVLDESGIPVTLDVETLGSAARSKMPPDEVVSWTLRARQQSQWEKFFLYMDIESMLVRNGPRQRQWRAESEEGRRRMAAHYREDLKSAVVDKDISMLPFEFTVERTVYSAENAEVTVLEKFTAGQYTEIKRFVYYLVRADGIWEIVDYTVTNIGTE